jgi:hypothetical protein
MSGQTLREIVRQVKDLLMEPGILVQAPTQELVRIGADLWTIATRVKVLAEEVKDNLRLQVPATPGQHMLYGPGASGMVTVPRPEPVVRKEVDPGILRDALGADFDHLFEVVTVVTPREGFEDALQRVKDPGRVQIALAAVDLVTHKARVSFQLKGAQSLLPQP